MKCALTTEDYLKHHHAEVAMLRRVNWSVFGTLNYPDEYSKTCRKVNDVRVNNTNKRHAICQSVLRKLARANQTSAHRLCYFVNNEYLPPADYWHTHMLIGSLGLVMTPQETCDYLHKLTADWKSDCSFTPYNDDLDGIGYVTKKTLSNGEELPPDYYYSRALLHILR